MTTISFGRVEQHIDMCEDNLKISTTLQNQDKYKIWDNILYTLTYQSNQAGEA
ncbi:hypothetical protein GCM10007392_30420 [Saccharospirillum salsuginis]|uniref:Uncharacterized protein n=1 Tax=Saccharospirillum salsuginis TaxID=418750 RepID=A0A918KGJ7_9GAMM|nr:hypothetical protein GCM10007392_30420 [Saccharospirillum salsuginis]